MPLAASAQGMIDAGDPEAIEALLKGFGIARLGESSGSGNPKISGRIEGKQYELYFYGCTENKNCKSVQFWAYWNKEVALDRLNEWNRSSRYGRVYLDEDKDVVLEFDINMSYGVAERTMEDNIDLWMQLVAVVQEQVVDR